jgi:hypothetical protein
MPGITNLHKLLATLQPHLHSGEFVFVSIDNQILIPIDEQIMHFTEEEGTTIICTRSYADRHQLTYTSVFGWITLNVLSSLDAVGLTASFSTALANCNISCNVVAGHFHDHIFVPIHDTQRAMNVLLSLSSTTLQDQTSQL